MTSTPFAGKCIPLQLSSDRATAALLAAIPAMFILYVSRSTGLSCWPDSVMYLLCADAIQSGRGFTLNLAEWNSVDSTETYHHHAPLLPMLLSAGAYMAGLLPETCARIVNAAAAFASSYLLLSNSRTALGRATTLTFVFSATFMTWHFGILTEPVFLALLSANAILLQSRLANAMSAGNTRHIAASILLMGVLSGLAILARYAGIFLVPATIAVFIRVSDRRRLLFFSAVYLLTVAAVAGWWFCYLKFSGTSARTIAVEPTGWHESIRTLCDTISGWILPRWISLKLRAVLLVCAAAGVRVLYARAPQANRASAACHMTYATVYLLFVVVSRLLFDAAIPFDDRMFSPFALFVLLAIIPLLPSAAKISRTALFVVAWLLGNLWCQNMSSLYASTYGITTDGSGWFKQAWIYHPIQDVIRSLPPTVRVYSNAAGGIAVIHRGRPMRWMPRTENELSFRQFADQAETQDAVIVVRRDHFEPSLSSEQVRILGERFRHTVVDDIDLFETRPR